MKNTSKKNYRSLKKADNFYRAEIKLNEHDYGYLVKLRKFKGNQVGFFVKQDSVIFNMLEADKVLEMKFWAGVATKTKKYIKTKVKSIEKQTRELLKGHYLVYVSILGSQD